MKLPRKLEEDPRLPAIKTALTTDSQPLWSESAIRVPRIRLNPALETALREARDFKQLERGLERIEQLLANEKRGLVAMQKKQGVPPAQRVSRLLLVANDGTDRFYRDCEKLVREHSDRLLCLRLDVTCLQLGQSLYGPDKAVKALLVSDRDAVVRFLLGLALT